MNRKESSLAHSGSGRAGTYVQKLERYITLVSTCTELGWVWTVHVTYYIASIVHCIRVQPPHWQGLGLQVSSSWTYICIVHGIDQQTMGLRTTGTSCHLSIATTYHFAIQPRISGVPCYQQLAHMRTISLVAQIHISIKISVCTDHNRQLKLYHMIIIINQKLTQSVERGPLAFTTPISQKIKRNEGGVRLRSYLKMKW